MTTVGRNWLVAGAVLLGVVWWSHGPLLVERTVVVERCEVAGPIGGAGNVGGR